MNQDHLGYIQNLSPVTVTTKKYCESHSNHKVTTSLRVLVSISLLQMKIMRLTKEESLSRGTVGQWWARWRTQFSSNLPVQKHACRRQNKQPNHGATLLTLGLEGSSGDNTEHQSNVREWKRMRNRVKNQLKDDHRDGKQNTEMWERRTQETGRKKMRDRQMQDCEGKPELPGRTGITAQRWSTYYLWVSGYERSWG